MNRQKKILISVTDWSSSFAEYISYERTLEGVEVDRELEYCGLLADILALEGADSFFLGELKEEVEYSVDEFGVAPAAGREHWALLGFVLVF